MGKPKWQLLWPLVVPETLLWNCSWTGGASHADATCNQFPLSSSRWPSHSSCRSEFVWQDKHKAEHQLFWMWKLQWPQRLQSVWDLFRRLPNYLSLYPRDNFNMLSVKMLTRNPRGISPLDLNGIWEASAIIWCKKKSIKETLHKDLGFTEVKKQSYNLTSKGVLM